MSFVYSLACANVAEFLGVLSGSIGQNVGLFQSLRSPGFAPPSLISGGTRGIYRPVLGSEGLMESAARRARESNCSAVCNCAKHSCRMHLRFVQL